MKRDDVVMALVNRDSREILFEFQQKKFASLIGLFAIGSGMTLWFLGEQVKQSAEWGYWFLCFLFVAMVVGFLTSLAMRRSVRIDKAKKRVEYRFKSMFSKASWTKGFNEFKEIRIYRPARGGGAGRAALLKVLLVLSDGEEIPLGTGFLGIFSVTQARHLASELASVMFLVVIEESGVS